MTTYFEGEIIGNNKHSFATNHPEWGSSWKLDKKHWEKFPAYRQLSSADKSANSSPNLMRREHVFMRWKENFLVPDHRVRNLRGASYEGFYYICFSRVTGSITGIYFHAQSEK